MSGVFVAANDRRAVVAGMAIILPLVLASKGVPIALHWQSNYVERVHAQIDAERRAVEAAHELPMLRAALAAQRAPLALLGTIVSEGAAPSVAAAKLGSIVDSMALGAAVQVSSLELSADTARRATVIPIHVRLTATCDVAGLMALMQSIEASREPLAVRELSVSAADPASPDTRAEVLHIDVIVASFVPRDGRAAGESP